MPKWKICVIDTTFARVDMGGLAVKTLRNLLPSAEIVRITVPGVKDLPGAAKRAIDDEKCDAVISLGWVGPKQVDKYSYLASSIGLMIVQILTNKIILDVTVHEDEAEDSKKLYEITVDRVKKHCENLVKMLVRPSELIRDAGKGKRQGYPDVGPINPKPK